jgi:hypothetical protein
MLCSSYSFKIDENRCCLAENLAPPNLPLSKHSSQLQVVSGPVLKSDHFPLHQQLIRKNLRLSLASVLL